jgi:hypothetical protein
VIALLMMLCIMAGVLLGWSGHKASLRVREWGLKMNEQDDIFREVSGTEGRASNPGGRGGPQSPIGNHLPLGVAGLK